MPSAKPIEFTIRIIGAEEMQETLRQTEDDFRYIMAKDVTPKDHGLSIRPKGYRARLETTARCIPIYSTKQG